MSQPSLATLVSGTGEWVDNRKQQITEAHLYEELSIQEPEERFYQMIAQARRIQRPVIIGEIKRRSPSAGALAPQDFDAVTQAQSYQSACIDAISYVSNGPFFGGSIEELRSLVSAVTVPILQKDIILETYQILEAAVMQVDAILLIARVLEQQQLHGFIELALLHGVEPVVEVYDQADLEAIKEMNVRIIGVNARNLDDFTVDTTHAERVIAKASEQAITIGFSGITDNHQVKRYTDAGASGVLVGTHLMQSSNPQAAISQLQSRSLS